MHCCPAYYEFYVFEHWVEFHGAYSCYVSPLCPVLVLATLSVWIRKDRKVLTYQFDEMSETVCSPEILKGLVRVQSIASITLY